MSDWQLKKDEDHRYTITVFLVRNQRPKYWEFHCPYCSTKIGEIDGDIVSMNDLPMDNGGNRFRCPGNKKWCRMWFQFVTLS